MATYLEIARVLRNQNAKDRISTGLLRMAAATRGSSPASLDDYKTVVLAEKLIGRLSEIADAMMLLAMLDATLRGLATQLMADVGVLTAPNETALETEIQRVVNTQFPVLAGQIISNSEAKARKG